MALLYGMNTTGAIVGALAAGLYLIPDRGIHGTFLVAATLNLLVGLCALAMGTVVVARRAPATERRDADGEPVRARAARSRAAAAWFSGFSPFRALRRSRSRSCGPGC